MSTSAFLQILPRPSLVAKTAGGSFAQLPQAYPRAASTILVSGKVAEEVAHQRVHTGVLCGAIAAHGSQDVVVYAERYILHPHSIRVTV